MERCLFLPILNSNAVAERMAREYWKMHAQASSCIADTALSPRNAFHPMQLLGFASYCIGWNALLGLRAVSAMQLSAFACIFQYSLAIRSAIPHYYSIVGSSLNNRWCVHFSMQIEELHVMT